MGQGLVVREADCGRLIKLRKDWLSPYVKMGNHWQILNRSDGL